MTRDCLPYQRVAPGQRRVTAALQLREEVVRIALTGVFDAETAPVLRTALRGACAAGADVLLDVGAARLTDQAAAREVADAAGVLAAAGHRLALCHCDPWTMKALTSVAREAGARRCTG